MSENNADNSTPPSFQPVRKSQVSKVQAVSARRISQRAGIDEMRTQTAPAKKAAKSDGFYDQTAGWEEMRAQNMAKSARFHSQSAGVDEMRAGNKAQKPRRKLRAKRVIAVIFLMLLLIVGAGIFWLVETYNELQSALNRTDALSLMKDNSKATTFLIVGNDGRSAEAQSDVEGARADTIMLLIHTDQQDSLISIPRDAMVELPPFIDKRGIFAQPGEEVEEVWAKINAAYNYGGAKLLVETVEELVGVKVDHYAEVGFEGVAQLTDVLGGVNLCYDREVNDPDSGMMWTPGCKDVNGQEALAYSRMRHQDPLSDIGRTLRQRIVVQKLAQKSSDLLTRGNFFNLWNVFKLKEVAKTALNTLTFDESTTIFDMYKFVNYFKNATSPTGYMDILPIENPDYYNQVLGSVVKVNQKTVREFITGLTQK